MKKIVLMLTIILGFGLTVNAQKDLNISNSKKHEFNIFYGMGGPNPGTISDIFVSAISNGIQGYPYGETSSFGMVGMGYRYKINRIKVGLDLGFSAAKEELFKKKGDKTPALRNNIYRLLVIPTGEFTYYKNNLLSLYGSVGAGALFSRKDNNAIKNYKPATKTEFAYQINPIGLKIGNGTIGGFIEAGFGYKGLAAAGINFNF